MAERSQPPRPDPSGPDTLTELAAPEGGPRQRIGDLIVDKYRLICRVAEGGMGTVWEAYDTQLERSVAVKFMSPAIAFDDHARQRFNREAKAAARLRTPHVVGVYEHGLDGDVPYIAMELLSGEDLGRKLKREKRLSLDEAAATITQIAKGLRAAHEEGIVHRDLKPQNIFLADEDGDLVVKVLDFGVAKMADAVSDTTKSGVLVGSPHYMSPEQARGLPDIDHRSDVWSLTAIAYRMVTGKLPFRGQGSGDVIINICTADLPVASAVAPHLPERVDAFFIDAFERDPSARIASAMDFAQGFSTMASAAPIAEDRELQTPASVSVDEREHSEDGSPAGITGPTIGGVTGMMDPVSPRTEERRLVFFALGGGALVLGGFLAFSLGDSSAESRATDPSETAAVPEPSPATTSVVTSPSAQGSLAAPSSTGAPPPESVAPPRAARRPPAQRPAASPRPAPPPSQKTPPKDWNSFGY